MKLNSLVFWNDPDNNLCSRKVKIVDDFSYEIEDSETILVEDEKGCRFEVFVSEINLINC